MAIDRAPFNALVDDDGSNTIGTPWNKAAIAYSILDPIDAALAPAVTAWTPIDMSAAGVALTGSTGYYVVMGRIVHVWAQVFFPTTSATQAIMIGGFPFTNALLTGFLVTYGQPALVHFAANLAHVIVMDPVSFASKTYANLSAQQLFFSGSYYKG